jgi:hypothetical protein
MKWSSGKKKQRLEAELQLEVNRRDFLLEVCNITTPPQMLTVNIEHI